MSLVPWGTCFAGLVKAKSSSARKVHFYWKFFKTSSVAPYVRARIKSKFIPFHHLLKTFLGWRDSCTRESDWSLHSKSPTNLQLYTITQQSYHSDAIVSSRFALHTTTRTSSHECPNECATITRILGRDMTEWHGSK